MNAKLVIVGTLAGALTLFAWETVSNTLLPWHAWTMRAFPDSNAAVQVIRAQVPDNGMYVDARGVVAAVSLAADTRSAARLGIMLGRQLVLDLVAAFLVLIVFVRLPRVSPLQCAAIAALMALAVAASVLVSDWNWYDFGAAWTVVNTVDHAIGYGFMGLALGAVITRFSGRARTDEWGGIEAPPRAYQSPVSSPTLGPPR